MASEPMSSPFGGSQSTVSSPTSDQTTPSPAAAAIERLRSTLPTEEAAQPAHVPTPKHRLHFPSLSSPRPSSKAKRSTGMLTLLRKPKPKWDDLKDKLRKRHKDHASDASEGLDSVSEQQDSESAEANGNYGCGLKEEGSQLESQESMMPDVLKPGQDLHVQVVSARGLRAADSNGLSDPYTVVHLGSRTDQTRVIQENLNPEWHETFVYSADDIQSALTEHMSSMLFEVWDSDFGLIADDFLGQAEFSLLDFKATDESTKVELPLYIEVKGERISSGCGSLTLLVWVTEKDAESGEEGGPAPTIVSTVCPTPNAVPKQLPSLVHDERGNTLYEEPSIAWMHVRISQVALVRHDREEDGMRALAKIFAPPGSRSRSRSRWKKWSLSKGSDSRSSSFTEEPQMHDTLKPDPSFKERRNLRRVISDDKESSSGKDDRGKLKTVKRKVVQLFGMTDKEEENQAADFEEDDALDALEQEEEERAEAQEQEKEGEDDADLDKEQLLYWEVSVGSQQHRSRLAPLSGTRSIAQWDQDFAFAVVLPLKTRPLMLELHQSKDGRRKGRPIARAYIPLAELFPSGRSDFGSNVEWFKLHDVDRRASGELEAAVSLAAACVDIDKRRAIYDLPLAVALEKRITKGHLEKISAQQSKSSFSSLHRPRETSEVTQEPPGEQEQSSGPQTLKEKFMSKLKSLSVMPSPNQALETFREESGGEMAAARSSRLSGPSTSKNESTMQLAEGPAHASGGGPPEAAWDAQPLLSHASVDSFSAAAAAGQQAPAGDGGPEQALQQESAKGDAGDIDAGAAGRAAAEPLSWSTRIASKLFIQKPKWERPAPPQALGMVQLLIKEVELETSETCFLLLRCGAQWGRSITLPSSKTHNLNWEVHMPVLEPSTLLQLALFKETGPRGTRKSVMAGLLRLRLNSLTSEVDHVAELPMCASRKQGGEKTATLGLKIKVSYFNQWRLFRTYILPVTPLGVFKHGLNKGDVRKMLERETNCIIMRWLETSNPPVARAVAEVLIRSPQDTFAMSRVKANWRRIATWFDGFKKAGEGWAYLQSWEDPGATIGTMAALSGICCFPHVMVSLALTGLVIFMIAAYPKEDVGKPLPMEPDPEADEDDDDEDNELQGTIVTRLQRRVDGMQKIALKVQNVLDIVAGILERCRGLVCWADPNASAFFLLIATSWALGVAVLGLHTILSFLLCWMLRPPFLRVLKPPPPVSFVGRLPTKADQMT